MVVYIGELIFYIILGLIEFAVMGQLSALGFICLFYVMPIIFTIIVTGIKSSNSKLLVRNLLSSSLATISYIILGLIFEHNGMWKVFVQKNTINIKNAWIHINNSMVGFLQILFILILYFGLGYLAYFINRKNSEKSRQ